MKVGNPRPFYCSLKRFSHHAGSKAREEEIRVEMGRKSPKSFSYKMSFNRNDPALSGFFVSSTRILRFCQSMF